ncbi:MAG: histidine kinase [Propionibacteriaceae bacterium]|jgi:signal transduction histidine kinase|nr:histidine kinase [Propionibacteriaceae bacterium]
MRPETWLLVVTCVLLVGSYAVLGLLLARLARSRRQALADRSIALEAEREQIAGLAVASERTRIVREMHDVIAHSLAIMVAQADGGKYAVADQDAATRAFETISDTGRTALADTRRILGMLRNPDAEAELLPTPDETGIDTLVARAQDAGLAISLIRVGVPGELPAASSLALYRICQEAITNVMKHGEPGMPCVVTENWRDDEVVITVTNELSRPAPEQSGSGQGLIGMRERAELTGGSLAAGPIHEGFRVRALIPYSTLSGFEEQ